MPEVTSYAPGTPCWVDLMAKNQQEALDLYRDLFGWQGEVGPPEFGGYAVCLLNGKPVAGIGPTMAPEGMPEPPTVWTSYLATSDADVAQQAITANGGTVMVPVMDVGTTGRMLIAADPTGAVFGVWQPVDFIGAEIVNEPGALIWNELHTTDMAAAKAFYKALNIEIAPMEGPDVEGMPDYHGLKVEGRDVGGAMVDAAPGMPPHWRVYFAVDDVDSTVDALVKRGGNVLEPAADTPVGRIALLQDPQGGVFAVIKPKPM